MSLYLEKSPLMSLLNFAIECSAKLDQQIKLLQSWLGAKTIASSIQSASSMNVSKGIASSLWTLDRKNEPKMSL